jgi:hypothetical protein
MACLTVQLFLDVRTNLISLPIPGFKFSNKKHQLRSVTDRLLTLESLAIIFVGALDIVDRAIDGGGERDSIELILAMSNCFHCDGQFRKFTCLLLKKTVVDVRCVVAGTNFSNNAGAFYYWARVRKGVMHT